MMCSTKHEILLNAIKKIIICNFLGEGGQGEVYLVNCNGKPYALKVYKNDVSSGFRFNLKKQH